MTDRKLTAPKGRRVGAAGPLTTADLVVLSLLAERAMHGYELLGEYDRQEVADWASVSRAQVYYAIQKLAGLELIEPVGSAVPDGDRERATYYPTKAGEQALRDGVSGKRWAESRIAQPFATWLGLSIHLPADEKKRIFLQRHAFLISELDRERKSLAFIATLSSPRARAGEQVVRLVIAQMEAELVWLSILSETEYSRASSDAPS